MTNARSIYGLSALLLLVANFPQDRQHDGGRLFAVVPPNPLSPSTFLEPPDFVVSANLVSFGNYRVIPDFERLGNTTVPNYLGSIQSIDGVFVTMDPALAILKYSNQYFIVPRSARFSLDKYGHFCGRSWGWGSGNDAKPPLADGGLDAACREHDKAWSDPSNGTRVRDGDAVFAASLAAIRPRWSYESEYRDIALRWMACRRANGVVVASANEPKCRTEAVFPAVRTVMSRIVRS